MLYKIISLVFSVCMEETETPMHDFYSCTKTSYLWMEPAKTLSEQVLEIFSLGRSWLSGAK